MLYTASACGDDRNTGEDSGEVVVDSWGGSFQEAQSSVLFSPFAAASGVEVVELSDGENIYAKVASESGEEIGSIDLIHGDASWLTRGAEDGFWAPIDYDRLDEASLYDDARSEFGVGILYWSFNIVYRDDAFGSDRLADWTDVWDYALVNPGRVALWSARPNYTLEVALMAAGYQPDDVYPLDDSKIEEAYASLDRIKDGIRFYETGAQGERLFTSGEVDVAMYYGGDAFGLIDRGEDIVVEWNQGVYTRDYWLVPANAPHYEEAMELISFALEAQQQAEFATATGYGPVNPASSDLVGVGTASRLPSTPSNKARQLSYDYLWWGLNDDRMLEQWNAWLRG